MLNYNRITFISPANHFLKVIWIILFQFKIKMHLNEKNIFIAFRGYKVRQKYGPLLNSNTGKIDLETSKFIRPYAKRWKVKSIFQILLLYRSARYQDLVNLTQQVCSIDVDKSTDF